MVTIRSAWPFPYSLVRFGTNWYDLVRSRTFWYTAKHFCGVFRNAADGLVPAWPKGTKPFGVRKIVVRWQIGSH